MTAVVASDSTYGANTTSRSRERPRTDAFSSRASPMLIGNWMATDSTAMITLCSIAERNTGSDSASE